MRTVTGWAGLGAAAGLALGAAACGGGDTTSPDAGSPVDCAKTTPASIDAVFARSFAPGTPTSCASCHGAGGAHPVFTTPQELWNVTVGRPSTLSPSRPLVDPGRPDNSELYRRLAGLGPGARMPPSGPGLDDAALAQVAGWICSGAPGPVPPGDGGPDGGPVDGGAPDAGDTDAGPADGGPGPTPSITAFAPAAGTPGTAVVVLGRDFSPIAAEDRVFFGDVEAPISAASADRLDTSVPAGAASGPIKVVVRGVAATSAESFTVLVPNPVPVVTSVSPATVETGPDAVELTVVGSGFTAASVVRLDDHALATQFDDATRLTAYVDARFHAEAGSHAVVVSNPPPGGGTSTPREFRVENAVPDLDSLEPAALSAGGGAATISARGSRFVPASVVLLQGTAATTRFVSSGELEADVPAALVAAAGALRVEVRTPAPGGGTSRSISLAVNHPLPLLLSLSPAQGLAGSTTALSAAGTRFAPGAVVRLDEHVLATERVSDTLLTAVLPVDHVATGGSHSVSVVNPPPGGGSSAVLSWTVLNPVPTASAVAPDRLPTGGAPAVVTVTGAGFNTATVARLDGQPLDTIVDDPNTLRATIPALAAAGIRTLDVLNPAPGGGASAPLDLVAFVPVRPAITGLSPNPVAAGAPVLVRASGSGFACQAPASEVRLSGAPLVVEACEATRLDVLVPALAAGGYAVVVRDPASGLDSDPATLVAAAPNPVPNALLFAPAWGVVGSTSLTVRVDGSGFVSTSVVRVNGAARPTTFVSATRITARLSAGDLAVVQSLALAVENPAPGGGLSQPLSFPVLAPNPVPALLALEPSRALAGTPGITVALVGSGFVPASVVLVGDGPRTTRYVDPTTLQADLTASDLQAPGALALSVDNPVPGGGTSQALTLAVYVPNPLPAVTSLSPSSVLVGDGPRSVTVTGTGFVAESYARLGGTRRDTTLVSPTELRVELPASDFAAAGDYALDVVSPAPGGGTSAPATLRVANPLPSVASLAPASIVRGSASFLLAVGGAGFVASSVASLGGVALVTHVNGATDLSAEVPASLVASAGARALVVTNPAPGGGASSPFTLSVENPRPVLASLEPSAVARGADAPITLRGSGFMDGSSVSVDTETLAPVFASTTQLNVSLPASMLAASGSRSLRVSNPSPGGGTSDAVTLLVVNPAPVLTAIQPAATAVGSAPQLVATGFGFVPESLVRLGEVALTTQYVSATRLTADVPASATQTPGTLEVTVRTPAPGGGTSGGRAFAVNNPAPTISAISPCGVVAGAATFTLTIDGSGFLPDTAVTFAGASVPTTRVSATRLTATVSGTLVAAAPAGRAATVAVTNPAPGGGTATRVFGIAAAAATVAAVQTHFNGTCTGCHGSGMALSLAPGETRAGLVGVRSERCDGRMRVVACDPTPAGSLLVELLDAATHGTTPACGNPMPPSGTALSDAAVRTVMDWIAQGAP